MLALAPRSLPAPGPSGGSVFPAIGEKRGRVALLQGCAQQVLAPRINQAAINLLTRHGVEVVLVKDEQCCGALTHHLGRDDDALARARANISVWAAEAERNGLDAILVTASCCARTANSRLLQRRSRRWPRTSRSMSAPSIYCRRSNKATLSSPIIRPVRCSTDRKSRRPRKNCFPRTDSW